MTTKPEPIETPLTDALRDKLGNSNLDGLDQLEKMTRHAASFERTIADLTKRLERAQEDTRRLDWLVEAAGYFQDDSFTTVKFSGDDATRTWHLDIGKGHWWGGSIRAALDAAISAALAKPKGEDTQPSHA